MYSTRRVINGEEELEGLLGQGEDEALYEVVRRRRSRTHQPTIQSVPLGPPINACTGSNLLSAAQVGRAIEQNRRFGTRLGWKNRYVPISTYYLRCRTQIPSASEFAQAVARWQQAVGLTADGVLGPTTWQVMRPRGEPSTFTTPAGVVRPSNFAQVIATFGDPRPNPRAWAAANIVRASAPTGFQFRLLSGGTSSTVQVHRLVQTHFEDLFRAIAAAGLWEDIQPVSGPFAFRNIRGSTHLSMHAFGLALDINPDWYARGQCCAYPVPRLVQIFQDHGFHWGIFFPTSDAMHFQFATGV